MARRKKAHRRQRSRRKLSGLGKIGAGALVKIAGAVAGKVLTNVVDKQLPESGFKKWVVSATPIAGGLITGMISKQSWAKDLADGMYIVGGLQLVQQTGAIGALVDDDTSYNRNFVALGPTYQNPRGVVAGIGEMSLEKAALFS